MSRLNLVLLALLVASSLVLVKVAYDSRRSFVALERAHAEARALEVDYKRLEAERQAQATHGRVERVARQRLEMLTPVETRFVHDGVAASAATTAAAGATAAPASVAAASGGALASAAPAVEPVR